MERKVCIQCPDYLNETCDAQKEKCEKFVPQVIIDRSRACGEECLPTDIFLDDTVQDD